MRPPRVDERPDRKGLAVATTTRAKIAEPSMLQQAYVFDVRPADDPEVSRTVAIAPDQTLDDLHALLRTAFEWHGDFAYAFALADGREYAGGPGEEADIPLARLDLDGNIDHTVDGPEEWRFVLRLLDVRSGDETLPRVLERDGEISLDPEVELGGGD
jgi:hypothetical protein